MPRNNRAIFLLPLCLTQCLGDVLGPTYPSPFDLSSENSPVPAAWNEFKGVLDTYLDGSIEDEATAEVLAGLENVTFSIGVFSLNDPAVSENLQYHYSSPATKESENGTKEVDGDTIYQLASITKLFTVYAGLLTLTEEQWNTPLLECIPALGQAVQAQSNEDDSIVNTPWNQITPWALANHMSNIATHPFLLDLIAAAPELAHLGLPVSPKFEEAVSAVAAIGELDEEAYFGVAATLPSVLAPWSTSLYSNNGFVILGAALTNLLGKPYVDLMQDTVAAPLGLNSTSAAPPTDQSALDRSAILTPAFSTSAPLLASSGGIFSTLNDLALFGTALLNSTQLPPHLTRKWMKPSGHTASVNHSVGAPWEINRYTSPATGKVTDFYTKSGESGDATTHFILIPDYQVGFTYLSASNTAAQPQRQILVYSVLDLLTASLLPALEAQAAAEALANFGGTYTSTDPALNASVTIAWNESNIAGAPGPALTLTEFSYNNTDLASLLFAASKPRLLLSFPDQDEKGQVAFQATDNTAQPAAGIFSSIFSRNFDWLTFGGSTWSGNPVGSFVFHVDGEGKATAVVPAVLGLKLERAPEEK